MLKKYELLENVTMFDGVALHRIQALQDFADVKEGDVGGFVEHEGNLNHNGSCWIYNDAKVYNDASISGDAQVHDYATVSDNSIISGNARIYMQTGIIGTSIIGRNVQIEGDSIIIDTEISCSFEGSVRATMASCVIIDGEVIDKTTKIPTGVTIRNALSHSNKNDDPELINKQALAFLALKTHVENYYKGQSMMPEFIQDEPAQQDEAIGFITRNMLELYDESLKEFDESSDEEDSLEDEAK